MNRKGNLLTLVVIMLTFLVITTLSLSSLINILTKQNIYTENYLKGYEEREELFEQIYYAICNKQTFLICNDFVITLQTIVELRPQPYDYDSNNNPVYLPEPPSFSFSFYSDFYLPFTTIQPKQGAVVLFQQSNNQKSVTFFSNPFNGQITVPANSVGVYLQDWQPYYETVIYEAEVRDKNNHEEKFYFIKYNNKIVFVF